VRITEIEIDAGNELHVTGHGVSLVEVAQVFANHPDIRRNRKNRASTHVALGMTDGGRKVLIPFIDHGDGRFGR
jgi:hypothetical protein